MRREAAFVVAGVLSYLLAVPVALLGDGRAQYGMAPWVIALPLYCTIVALIYAPTYALIQRNRVNGMAAYGLVALGTGVVAFLLVFGAGGGAVAGVAAAVSFGSAFVLVPLLEGRSEPYERSLTSTSARPKG